jgi:hypothetical protein
LEAPVIRRSDHGEDSPWSAREAELLAVTLQLLQEHGYDRLTVDAVANLWLEDITGEDALSWVRREFDMRTSEFVDGGFDLPEAKTQISWAVHFRSPLHVTVVTLLGKAYGGWPERCQDVRSSSRRSG